MTNTALSDAPPAVEQAVEPAAPAKKLSWVRIAIWAVVVLLLIFIAWGLINAFAAPPMMGQPAPDFTMALYQGSGDFTLSDYRGQVVVINFWASWCGPCAEEAPGLQAAWENYRDQGVMFIGVDWVDAEANALDFIAKYGVTYPNGADLGTDIADQYHIRGVPETFIVDRNGKVTFYAPYPLTYEQLSAEIEQALEQPAESGS